MDEMIAFLRPIAEGPDDDAARLVFSDWLDDHGHHERAEFIRLQVELARMDQGDDGYGLPASSRGAASGTRRVPPSVGGLRCSSHSSEASGRRHLE